MASAALIGLRGPGGSRTSRGCRCAGRDELRAAWPSEPIRRPVDVEQNIRDFIRKAEDRAARMRRGYTSPDVRVVESWTDGVVAFLSEHASEHATSFIEAAQGESPRDSLTKRAAALRRILTHSESE